MERNSDVESSLVFGKIALQQVKLHHIYHQ